MQRIVLDTNVIVSAMLTPKGIPAEILNIVLSEKVSVAASREIIDGYNDVLYRKKFRARFTPSDIGNVLNAICLIADYFVPKTSTAPQFLDESDRKFYDLAKAANAYLITGNIKHFPQDPMIVTPADFLTIVTSGSRSDR